MKTRQVLSARERKALWVDVETYEIVKKFAHDHGISIAYATFLIIGKALVEMEGGDFQKSRLLKDLPNE